MRGGHPVYRDEPFAGMHWLGLTRAQQDTIIAAACVDDLEESAITRDGRWFLVPHTILLPYIRPMGKGTRPTSVHRKAYDQRIGNLRALGIVRSQRDRQGILWIRADAVAWAHQHRPGTVERRQQHTKEEAGSAPPLPAKIKGDRVKESKPRTPESDATPTRPVVAS